MNGQNIIQKIGDLIVDELGMKPITRECSDFHAFNNNFWGLEQIGKSWLNSEECFDSGTTRCGAIPLVHQGKVLKNIAGLFTENQQAKMVEQSDENGLWPMMIKSEAMKDFLAIIPLKVPYRMSNGQIMMINFGVHYRDINYNEADFVFLSTDKDIPIEEYEKAYAWMQLAA